ncbi:hypothetical protein F0L68_07345 [Solihabitans fulvus]|uniref:Trypsin-like peptidase domain-containing protein n=1 Tax=Solihabitans fulvus TaxID=1892852 RepID=A0A5B2XQ24_9PSEU|nr:hypothetical protein F0L68_07345 [Solihabitans fulvus]
MRRAIRAVKHEVEDDLLALPGVVAVDIGRRTVAGRETGQPAIVVSVLAKLPRERVPAGQLIPAAVRGVPVDVVEDEVVLHRALLSADGPPVDGPPLAVPVLGAERHDVVVGGISVGPCRSIRLVPPDAPETGDYVIVGTLGALVTDRTGLGQVMALTNFHVACVDDAWMVGDEMAHPSRVDGGSCSGTVLGTLARAALSGAVNGAALLLDPAVRYEPSIVDIGPVRGHAVADVGARVRKRGRTTALTAGVVVSTDLTLSVDFGDGIGVRTLRDQLRVAADPGFGFGDRGDSGSVLVDEANRIVGLYFAGNAAGTHGFANPIARVLDELDVDILVS